MTTYDPEASASETLEFTDGVTTVPANFLDALEVRFGNPRDAVVALRDLDSSTAVLSDPNGDIEALEVIDAVEVSDALSLVRSAQWDINSESLFIEVTGTKVAQRSLTAVTGGATAFGAYTPAREYTMSWAALSSPTITHIYASDLYLAVIGIGGGAYRCDVFDLTAQALVGTYSLPGTPAGAIAAHSHSKMVMGREHIFIQTSDSGFKLHAVLLATATLDTSWATSGVFTLNYGESNLCIDDRRIYAMNDDDLEMITIEDGTQYGTNTGMGTGTNNVGCCTDGKGNFFLLQSTGANYLGRYRLDDNGDMALVTEETLGTNAPLGNPVCCGRVVYCAQESAPPLLAYDARDLRLIDRGPATPAATRFADNAIRFDGLNIVGATLASNGWDDDGFVRLAAVHRVRHVRRVAQLSYGRGPFKGGLVPVDF